MNDHPLRKGKSKVRIEKSNYRNLKPTEKNISKISKFINRIGQHFADSEDNIEFIIDSIVMPNVNSGYGSKTPHFKMFLVSEYDKPTTSRAYEYTRCSEIMSAKYVKWVPRGSSTIAAAILAKKPRDKARAPNQTATGDKL